MILEKPSQMWKVVWRCPVSLIEQLGGYERAKAFLNAASYTMDELIMMQRIGLRPQHVKKALLEYRRQHNIFEVGDKVVFIESELKNPRLMTVIEVSEPICGFLMAECSLGITNGFYPSRYRHATDEEIKAGKRLEGGK